MCGVAADVVTDVHADGMDCAMRVLRRPLASHDWTPLVTHVRSLRVVQDDKGSLAVSPDEK